MSATVMIVDDEPEVVRLLEVILSRAGFGVIKAGSGNECLLLLRQRDPDVIILDNMMPGMSGIEVMKSLHSIYKSITLPPVIFLSARGGMDAMLEGLQAGAYKYLVKPTSREKLVEVVRAAVDYGESKRHPEVPPPDWM
jgi:DNA-binding response OmpR family regulator